MIYTADPGHEQPPSSLLCHVLPRPRQPKAVVPTMPKLAPGLQGRRCPGTGWYKVELEGCGQVYLEAVFCWPCWWASSCLWMRV